MNLKQFPTLYKKNNNGKIQQWDIRVSAETFEESNALFAEIHTDFGVVGGAIQTTCDRISEGKNLGKVNETSPLTQALAEAQAKWQKQKDKGYVESKSDAKAGIDEVLGFKPMLAQSFDKHAKKIKFPCIVQPKLDGIRCLATLTPDGVLLTSRTGKVITSVPHIESQLAKAFPNQILQLDGELYLHEHKADFEKIVSAVRKLEPTPESASIEYHIYDVVSDQGYVERYAPVHHLLSGFGQSLNIKPVKRSLVHNEDAARKHFHQYLEQGYEGAMLRNLDGGYEHKRSYNLQKLKVFEDDEFKIVGVSEGRGKLMGHAASFICENSDGTQFEAKLEGSLDRLKEYFENPSLWQNKKLTVRYQGLTAKNKVPRFPVGVSIRDYE